MQTPSGPFGYIRLRTFAPENGDVDAAVAEFGRLLTLMPPQGLILDVRGNGGGIIYFGERILQMLTPRRITPESFHFMATPLTYRMAGAIDWLSEWRGAIGQAIETGSTFSQGFPVTPPESCNDTGQIYQGPVVLVTDALCYSTTDIFAAGFQDHEIGRIVGVHNNTGAGGANVWDHQLLQALLAGANNPFVALPANASMRTAVRRSTRVGARSGVPLEDLGVVPDIRYAMTRNDVLNNNEDLIAFCAAVLSNDMDRQVLRINTSGKAPFRELTLESENLDRVDIFVDGRPVLSQDVKDGTVIVKLPAPVASGAKVVANGYRAGEFAVCARR
jgi:C-terminal processing protease CtpA/Prc